MPLVRWQKENEKMAKGTKKEKSKIYKDNYHVHFNQSAKIKGFQEIGIFCRRSRRMQKNSLLLKKLVSVVWERKPKSKG